jgi:hypothetical protein
MIAIWLVMIGAGTGMGWAHLASHVLAVAREGEREPAAASISTVQLMATAFGSALAGMTANLAGLSNPGSVGGAADAAGGSSPCSRQRSTSWRHHCPCVESLSRAARRSDPGHSRSQVEKSARECWTLR